MKKITLLLLALCFCSTSASINADCITRGEAQELLIHNFDTTSRSLPKYSVMTEMLEDLWITSELNMQGEILKQYYFAAFTDSGIIYGIKISCDGEVKEYSKKEYDYN